MMCVSLSREFWQKIFITLNTLFVIFNIILLILGIITQNTLSKYTTILNTPISAIIPTILFTGCFGLIAALIGYIGLWKPMNSIALMHIISLCIVTLIEIGIATTSAVMYDQFYTTTHSALLDTVKFYYEKPQYEMEMDHLQSEFKCCGAESYLDYRKLGLNIPFSCIIGYLVYARGCVHILTDYIQQYTIVFISLCFIFSIIQGVYLIISILMLNRTMDTKNLCT
ncbi:hypothetical protein MS3_00002420 [Schistosoma haematobium]|uniref:Tetraspanin n=1 Tax=Schistosoma haematobium TaxID=6185 RepID=A0A922S7B5_SCHHA|nr:hypothetical protein MS3_00002420 [Schistosoma haematobium]KAH9596896.1 hypothetical protein MS3_00002420 [Schistosoma haematobium]CAH8492221.1 unnamed protein product [Schistosoma haematobium]CAH8493177.1 unnamed protein product [Schistosoma haematobium]